MDYFSIEIIKQITYAYLMAIRFLRISLYITSFVFLSGFLPFVSLIGPGVTIASSGNVYKAGAQLVIDHHIKKKTGKNSLTFVKEEMKKQNDKKNFDKELYQLVKKRIIITQKKLIEQNKQKKINDKFKKLIEKRILIVQKKLTLNRVNQ